MSALFKSGLVFVVFFLIIGLMWVYDRLVCKNNATSRPSLKWHWFIVVGLVGAISYYIWQGMIIPDREVTTEILGWIIGVPVFGLLSIPVLGNTGMAWPGVIFGVLYGAGSGGFLLRNLLDESSEGNHIWFG